MLSREMWRSQPDRVRAALDSRVSDAPFDALIAAHVRWREAQSRLEALKAERNRGSKEVGALFKAGRRDEAEVLKARMGEVGAQLAALESAAEA